MSKVYVRNGKAHAALSDAIPDSLLYHSAKMLVLRDERMHACIATLFQKKTELKEQGFTTDDAVVWSACFQSAAQCMPVCFTNVYWCMA